MRLRVEDLLFGLSLLFCVLFLSGGRAVAEGEGEGEGDTLVCEWDLGGDQMAPPVTTAAEGTAQLFVSPLGVMRLVIDHDVSNADTAGLYIGRADEDGPLVIGFGPADTPPIEYVFSTEDVDLISPLTDLAINVRITSTGHADGEIRGQYACADPEETDDDEYLYMKLNGDGWAQPVPGIFA